MMKKFTVVLFAPMILGAFGACKNEPDTINVTVPPPVVLPSDGTDIGFVQVPSRKSGSGGNYETTTVLWFDLNRDDLNGYQPKDVLYTTYGDNGETKEISIAALTCVGVDKEITTPANHWFVYSAAINAKTPITANGSVSFELTAETGSDARVHKRVTVPVSYAAPVQAIFTAKDGSTERGTTELTVELRKNGIKLFPASATDEITEKLLKVYVDGAPVAVVYDYINKTATIPINNRNEVYKPVEVVIKGEEDDDFSGVSYSVANRSTAVPVSRAVSIIEFEKVPVIAGGTTNIKANSKADGDIDVRINGSNFSPITGEKYVALKKETTTLPPIENRGEAGINATVSIELDVTDVDSNGYYIPTSVTIIPAVKVERRSFIWGSDTFYGYLDPKESNKYDYYFTTKGGLYYPDPFANDASNVTVKDKDGAILGEVSEFKSYTDWTDEGLNGTVKELAKSFQDIKKVYKITFTLTAEKKTTDDAIFVVEDDKQPNGYYIPAVRIIP